MEKKVKQYIRKVSRNNSSYSIALPKELVERLKLNESKVRIIELENSIIIEKI